MALSIISKVTIEVVFYVREDNNSPYQGRLEFDPKEYDALAPKDIEALQLAQFDAWKAAQANAKEVPPPTAQDKIAQLDALTAQKADLENQIAVLTADPDVVDAKKG